MAEAILAVKNLYIRNRSLVLLLIKIIIAVFFLTYLIHSLSISKTVSVFADADKYFLSAAFLLSIANIYLQFLKWRLVCSECLGENDPGKIIRSLFYGFTAGSFTPARIGEYAGRAVPFTDKSLLRVSSAVFIDKLFSLLIVFVIGSVSFLLFLNPGIFYSIAITLLFTLLSYILIKGLILSPLLKKIINRRKWSSDLFSGIAVLKQSSNRFRIKMLSISFLFYLCFIIQFALLVIAFSHQYDFLKYMWSGNLVMFAKTVIPPVSLGELGIREGASVFFLKHAGVSAAAGFNAAIFLFLINVLLPALTGMFFLLKRK